VRKSVPEKTIALISPPVAASPWADRLYDACALAGDKTLKLLLESSATVESSGDR